MSRARLFRSSLAAVVTAQVGCGGSPAAPPASRPACGLSAIHIGGDAGDTLVLEDDCGNRVSLLPGVRLDGAWHGFGQDGSCSVDGDAVRCPAAGGTVRATIADAVVTTRFTAASPARVEGVGLRGKASIAGATAWLSNGFQSWSQSGAVAVAAPVDDDAFQAALTARADAEVLRAGSELSWTFTYTGGRYADGTPGPSLFAGALSAARFKPWARLYDDGGGALSIELVSGGTGEQVDVDAGGTVDGEPWRIELGDGLEDMLRRYAEALPSRRMQKSAPAPSGWNSWYELWDGVDRDAVLANAALAESTLRPLLPASAGQLRIVVDDGWQLAWGDWQANAKFPGGLGALAEELEAASFTAGVWLAPLLAAEGSEVQKAHPDWFVGGASYSHPKHGPMRVLDATHPDALAHLQTTIQTLVGWGYGLLKIDFLFAGTFEGERYEQVTGMEAYARALAAIREAAGEGTLLLAVGAPGVASFPYVDGWRVGADIAFENTGAKWAFLPNQARSVAARWPLCLATLCDADPILLRDLSQGEVEAGGAIVAFAGGALFLSDDLRALPAERRSYLPDPSLLAHALGGVPSVPLDPYPASPPATLANVVIDIVKQQSTHVVPRVWRAPSGARYALNSGDEPATIEGVAVPPHAVRPLP